MVIGAGAGLAVEYEFGLPPTHPTFIEARIIMHRMLHNVVLGTCVCQVQSHIQISGTRDRIFVYPGTRVLTIAEVPVL